MEAEFYCSDPALRPVLASVAFRSGLLVPALSPVVPAPLCQNWLAPALTTVRCKGVSATGPRLKTTTLSPRRMPSPAIFNARRPSGRRPLGTERPVPKRTFGFSPPVNLPPRRTRGWGAGGTLPRAAALRFSSRGVRGAQSTARLGQGSTSEGLFCGARKLRVGRVQTVIPHITNSHIHQLPC